jgi:hypothetical protein
MGWTLKGHASLGMQRAKRRVREAQGRAGDSPRLFSAKGKVVEKGTLHIELIPKSTDHDEFLKFNFWDTLKI